MKLLTWVRMHTVMAGVVRLSAGAGQWRRDRGAAQYMGVICFYPVLLSYQLRSLGGAMGQFYIVRKTTNGHVFQLLVRSLVGIQNGATVRETRYQMRN